MYGTRGDPSSRPHRGAIFLRSYRVTYILTQTNALGFHEAGVMLMTLKLAY
jgi:hypothetical protein